MPFKKIRSRLARDRARSVYVSLEHPASAEHGHLRVRLGADVWTAAGFRPDQFVELHWGDGEDAGSFLILPGEAGTKLVRPRGKDGRPVVPNDVTLATSVGDLPDDEEMEGVAGAVWVLRRDVRPSVKCVSRLHDGGVLVELPREWWRVTTPGSADERREAAEPAGPTPVPAVEVAAAVPAPAAVSPPARAADPAPTAVTPPPRPAETDRAEEERAERCIALIREGHMESTIIRKMNCTPQYLRDRERELSERTAAERAGQARRGTTADGPRAGEAA